LNALNVKVPRNILQEIKLYGSTGKKKTYSQEKIGGVTCKSPFIHSLPGRNSGSLLEKIRYSSPHKLRPLLIFKVPSRYREVPCS
jgi:hypothetical protein